MINLKGKQKGKIGQAIALISLVMSIKSAVWDNLSQDQRNRLTKSALGMVKRTEAQGKIVVRKLDSQARKIVDTVLPNKTTDEKEKDKL